MRARSGLNALLALSVAVACAVLPADGAKAIDAAMVGAGAAPSWQTDDVVKSLAYANGVIYVGGLFTRVRPPGAAPGSSSEVVRSGLAAFDADTGDLLPWAPTVTQGADPNLNVEALAVSADGATIYLGGKFTAVNGAGRANAAAVRADNGALTSWAPQIPGTVYAIAPVEGGTVYVGGLFGVVTSGGISSPRTNAVATDAAGTVLSWAPAVSGGAVRAINRAPDGSLIVLGGSFTQIGGAAHVGLMAVDPTAGSPIAAWGAGPQLSQDFQVWHQTGDAGHVYIAGVDYGGQFGHPEFDGTASLNWSDGSIFWADYCQGDTHGVALVGGALYAGGHGHDCSRVPGGYPKLTTHQGLYAESTTDGHMLGWFPKANSSTSAEETGTRVLATDGNQVFAGGDFTRINDRAQQGFVRFAGPDSTPPTPAAGGTPIAQALSNGTAAVRQPASSDPDDSSLTYRLYRDDTVQVASASATSSFWSLPTVSLIDPARPAGAHFYTVRVSDGTSTASYPASNTVDLPPVANDFSDDRHADVLARDTAGNLRSYPGNGSGGFLAGPSTLATGTGSLTALFDAGSFAGNGHNDLLARDPAGNLQLLSGTGTGLAAPLTVGRSWQSMTALAGGEDFTGDGYPDVLARDAAGNLLLYPGNGMAGFGARSTIGTGWGTMTAILSVGDFSGDGWADLVARDPAGNLLLYRGNGRGGFAAGRSTIGTGWGGFTALVAAGDFSGDGHPDLIARTSAGNLLLYPGTGASGFGAARTIGTGWKSLTITS